MNSRGGCEGYHVPCVNETSVRGVINGSDLSFCGQRRSRRQEEGDIPSLHKQKTAGTCGRVDGAHMWVKVILCKPLLNNEQDIQAVVLPARQHAEAPKARSRVSDLFCPKAVTQY